MIFNFSDGKSAEDNRACAAAGAAGTEHFFTKGGRPAYPPQNTATSTGMVRMDKIVLRHTRRTA